MYQCEEDALISSRAKLPSFFAAMSTAAVRALLFDYDGTLSPFRADPATAVPYPGVKRLLQQIQTCPRSRVVIVSGRQAKEVGRLLGLENIEIWGCHGLERLAAEGTLESVPLDAETTHAVAQTRSMLERAGLAGLIEPKPTGNAVHWRALPAEEANVVREKVQEVWAEAPDKSRLRMLRFDGGIEIGAASMNKGRVIHCVVAQLEKPYSMAYLGDDLTDEDAFRAIKGLGIGVLVRESYRETAADAWIRPPEEVMEFLNDWLIACGSQP